ncbi:transglutaminase-like cysteine peptidase [Sphingomicrobium marinum]|uniref:transglutaminase-like cysteine peptidase n=1 Tax=Sphingomicrobium marinum TaxID=1227950 RepID=UPI00223FA369|nr:transglutaminase-like cysteine peptidase [Sphingomicrobium marinum]
MMKVNRAPHILALAAAATLIPAAASAQSAPSVDRHAPPPALAMSSAPSLKASAILGGNGSSLQAILAGQQAATPSYTQYRPMAPAATSARPYVRAHRAALPAHASLPNLFGSVALSVSRTPFDQGWMRVANAGVSGRAAVYARDAAIDGDHAAIERINRYVNARIAYTSDTRQFGREDRWMRPDESFASGRGDCEDYAIAKMAMLKEAGFAADNLYIVVLKDLANLNDHAVLAVRHEGRFLILDNSHDRVEDANTISFFRPVMSFSSAGRWIHGFNRTPTTYSYQTASASWPDGPRLAMASATAPRSIFAQ